MGVCQCRTDSAPNQPSGPSFDHIKNPQQKNTNNSEIMGCFETQEGRHKAIGCLVITAILSLVILLPLSFSYIEYYEYGLEMRKSTGSVDLERVYSRGRYMVGPDTKFLKYQADAHHESLEELAVFSAGTGNESIGLEFGLDVDFTFLLIKEEIGQLHQELATSYEDIITSRAKDAIKNEAANVEFSEYFQDRTNVEARFREAVQTRWNANPPLHCMLDQFHLGRIRIPDSVAEKQLQSRIQNERNAMESLLQQAAVERELTAVEVNTIDLQKDKLLRTAEAEASLLRANARADADRIVQEAQINGLTMLFNSSGINTQEQKTAFTYIRTLMNRAELDLDVSYFDNVIRTISN